MRYKFKQYLLISLSLVFGYLFLKDFTFLQQRNAFFMPFPSMYFFFFSLLASVYIIIRVLSLFILMLHSSFSDIRLTEVKKIDAKKKKGTIHIVSVFFIFGLMIFFFSILYCYCYRCLLEFINFF